MLPYVFHIPTYSLCLILALCVSLPLFFFRIPKDLRKKAALMTLLIALGAVLGAKGLYLLALPDGISVKDAVFTGFVFHGGLIGGVLCGLAAAHWLRLPALSLSDAAAPCIAIGHGIGRIGCFCAGCCYGISVPPGWGFVMPDAIGAPHDAVLFPIQLIEAALNLTLGAFLLAYTRKFREPGQTAGLYLTIYAVTRFSLEFFRGDRVRGFAAGLSTGQWMSVALLLAGIALIGAYSVLHLELTDTRLALRSRLLGGLVPINITLALFRDAAGRAVFRAEIAGRPVTPGRTKKPSLNPATLLERLNPVHVRAFTAHIVLGVPDDAAATAQLTGLARAVLSILCACIRTSEGKTPRLDCSVQPSFRKGTLHAHLRLVLAFPTHALIKALLRALSEEKEKKRMQSTAS